MILSDSDTTDVNQNTNGIEPAKGFFIKAFDCQKNDTIISRLDLTKVEDCNADSYRSFQEENTGYNYTVIIRKNSKQFTATHCMVEVETHSAYCRKIGADDFQYLYKGPIPERCIMKASSTFSSVYNSST